MSFKFYPYIKYTEKNHLIKGKKTIKIESKLPYYQSKIKVKFDYVEDEIRSPLYNFIYPKEMLISPKK